MLPHRLLIEIALRGRKSADFRDSYSLIYTPRLPNFCLVFVVERETGSQNEMGLKVAGKAPERYHAGFSR